MRKKTFQKTIIIIAISALVITAFAPMLALIGQ